MTDLSPQEGTLSQPARYPALAVVNGSIYLFGGVTSAGGSDTTAIQRYNTDIELFPKNIAASLFGFQREDAYFKADTAAKEAPKVKF